MERPPVQPALSLLAWVCLMLGAVTALWVGEWRWAVSGLAAMVAVAAVGVYLADRRPR